MRETWRLLDFTYTDTVVWQAVGNLPGNTNEKRHCLCSFVFVNLVIPWVTESMLSTTDGEYWRKTYLELRQLERFPWAL